jgi:hypothetical protein
MAYTKEFVDFANIRCIYQQMDTQLKLTNIRLFIAQKRFVTVPIFILDDKWLIHRDHHLCIRKINPNEIPYISKEDQQWILHQIKDVRIKKWEDVIKYLYITEYPFIDEKITDFIDVNTLEPTVAWRQLVNNVLSPNATKDENLLTIYQATLPKGFVMKYQPHALIITPPNAGKSTIYRLIGRKEDKTTPKALLGTITAKGEKEPGLFDNQRTPLAVDQIESQEIENLVGYILDILESGVAEVSTANDSFKIESTCAFVIIANPMITKENKLNTFREIIMQLGKNTSAMGRRFGIIAYNNFKPIVAGYHDIDQHRQNIMVFRAIEDRAVKTLNKIWNHPRVIEFCHSKVYEEDILKLVDECNVPEVRSFLEIHCKEAYPHIRGGAIQCAIVDYMPLFAFASILEDMNDSIDIDTILNKLLQKAEIYFAKLKQINIDSINYILNGSGKNVKSDESVGN